MNYTIGTIVFALELLLFRRGDLRGRVVCTPCFKVSPTREVSGSNPGEGRCLCDEYEHLYTSHGCIYICMYLPMYIRKFIVTHKNFSFGMLTAKKFIEFEFRIVHENKNACVQNHGGHFE
ncbi:unnamed protein product [Chilo suppressalis]|uniref:Secreted protein n=1 Tax=Chilo suppressalis TaxID=168631 RepID=A0ABN8APH1_CHISP|nr:unnamed protein product [Chilo suppressalis]